MYKKLRNIIVEKPMAEFGCVLDSPQTTLDCLYKDGWWITEIFGSYATIVKHKRYSSKKHPGCFISRCVAIDVSAITPGAQKIIANIAKQQWKKYRNCLLESQY